MLNVYCDMLQMHSLREGRERERGRRGEGEGERERTTAVHGEEMDMECAIYHSLVQTILYIQYANLHNTRVHCTSHKVNQTGAYIHSPRVHSGELEVCIYKHHTLLHSLPAPLLPII